MEREKVQIIQFAGFVLFVLLRDVFLYIQVELVELVHSLSMKSKKRLAYDIKNICATRCGLLNDVTETDCTTRHRMVALTH